jgi:predicted enzyme related to lactoylglutathione lyase
MTRPVGYWQVDDMENATAALARTAATVVSEPQDVGGGTMVATLSDADDNAIGLIQLPG